MPPHQLESHIRRPFSLFFASHKKPSESFSLFHTLISVPCRVSLLHAENCLGISAETQVETTRLMQSLTVYKPKRIQIFRFHHISFCMNAYASVMTNKFLCIILQLKQRISVLSMVKIDVKRAAEKHNAE